MPKSRGLNPDPKNSIIKFDEMFDEEEIAKASKWSWDTWWNVICYGFCVVMVLVAIGYFYGHHTGYQLGYERGKDIGQIIGYRQGCEAD